MMNYRCWPTTSNGTQPASGDCDSDATSRKRSSKRALLVAVATAAMSSIASAQAYKCTAGGKTVYQDSPCDGTIGQSIIKRDATPAPAAAPKAAKATTTAQVESDNISKLRQSVGAMKALREYRENKADHERMRIAIDDWPVSSDAWVNKNKRYKPCTYAPRANCEDTEHTTTLRAQSLADFNRLMTARSAAFDAMMEARREYMRITGEKMPDALP